MGRGGLEGLPWLLGLLPRSLPHPPPLLLGLVLREGGERQRERRAAVVVGKAVVGVEGVGVAVKRQRVVAK